MSETIWITGACGFTGGHLAAFLRQMPDPPRLVGLDVRRGGESPVHELHAIDLADPAAVQAIASRTPPRRVIHLAGLRPPASDREMWHANVGGTAGLLEGLHRAGVTPRVLSIGSAAEYTPGEASPLREDAPATGASSYGRTKLAQSLMCLHLARQFGFEAVVARPFNLIGPGLSSCLVAGALVMQFAGGDTNSPVSVGNLHTSRDFVDVRDAVRAYWLLAATDGLHGVYNVCSGRATSVGKLVQLLVELTGRPRRVDVDAARVRASDPLEVYGDATRLRDATGWHAEISVEQSLSDMLVPA
jgi:nucleoside-diphosphate-sugar epimerase